MLLLLFLFLLLPFSPLPAHGQTAPLSEIENIVSLIEYRHYTWTVMNGKALVSFTTENDNEAQCLGDLTYDKLEEKLLIRCHDNDENLLFAIKSQERDFELYIPARESIFRGNIFLLEDSPDVEAHIKPFELYRALKPRAIPIQDSMIEESRPDQVTLQIVDNQNGEPKLSRKILSSPEGHILREIFYSPEGLPYMTILRRGFERFKLKATGKKASITYPRTIMIEANEENRLMTLQFRELEFHAHSIDNDWSLNAPEETKIVDLEDEIGEMEKEESK